MSLQTMGPRTGAFLLNEPHGTLHREEILMEANNGVEEPGTALVSVSTGGTGTAVAGTNTGNGTISAVVLDELATNGVYHVEIVSPAANAGGFQVTKDGVVVGNGVVAAEFSGGGITFTISDGATDFVAGDSWAITVAGVSTVWVPYAEGAHAGHGAAILYAQVDTGTGDPVKAVAIVRVCEVIAGRLIGSDAAFVQRLAANHVIAR